MVIVMCVSVSVCMRASNGGSDVCECECMRASNGDSDVCECECECDVSVHARY